MDKSVHPIGSSVQIQLRQVISGCHTVGFARWATRHSHLMPNLAGMAFGGPTTFGGATGVGNFGGVGLVFLKKIYI